MGFLYETHLHTCQGSACGVSAGHEYPAIYKAMGYQGIFVTDHFFQGNCAVDRSLPWRKRVDLYMAGYRDAKRAGDEIGFDVFFGIEQNFEGDEYLLYGVDERFLYDNPDFERLSRAQMTRRMHEAGGCVVQAHPFRERGYLTRVHLSPFGVDAVEGVNTANTPEQDALAIRYAKKLGLPVTAGNDIHSAPRIVPERMAATVLARRAESAADYARIIRSGQDFSIQAPAGRGEWTGDEKISLPVTVHGEYDEVLGHDASPYL